MSTARKFDPISVADYLIGERSATRKHEYVCGEVYAQAGATNAHNRIATNVVIELGQQLRGNPCQVYNSDTKIRVRGTDGTRFFYPDASVVCDSNPPDDTFQDNPVIIVEVLSPSTKRVDLGEKRASYQSISSLDTYLLLDQSAVAAIVFQRDEQGVFQRSSFAGTDSVILLGSIDSQISLADIYENVQLISDDDMDDPR
jgi:Uma2 family endonuclease